MAKSASTKPAAKTAKPVAAKPAAGTYKVLVNDPVLRGSRAARWPLVVQAGNQDTLATLLKDGGFKQTATGTMRWLTKAGLVSLD